QQSRDAESGAPGLDVDLKIHRQEERLELVWRHGGEHPPHRGHLPRLLAPHDFYESLALARNGLLLAHQPDRAVAVVDRAREMHKEPTGEPVESDVAEMTLVDLPRGCGFAEAVGRRRIELAGATVRAVAIGEFVGAHAPLDRCHCVSPYLGV